MFDGMTADEIWTFVGIWAFFAAVVALIASSRGRSQVNWFLASFLVSPIIAFVALAVMPNLKQRPPAIGEKNMPPCPRCQAPRQTGERNCGSCGLDLWADYDSRSKTA